MRIIYNPQDQKYWWYFHPKVIYARVHAIYSNTRLGIIWVRPLDDDEYKSLEELMGTQA